MRKIFLASPHMSEEGYEMQYIEEAFATNWIAPFGTNVNEFEREVASLIGVSSAAALCSGTAAVHMALKAAGVEEGDVVFCSTLTFSASANPIIYQKAIPVFIDCDEDTWNISPRLLREAFIKYAELGKLPKAVIVVHLYGLSADMDEIITLCQEYGVVLIEDAAESLGTLYKYRFTGSIGDYGIFSFNGNKIITTSGGGMLVSNKEERIEKVKFWSTQASDPARHYEHNELGYNYRLSNVAAGIGRGQLKVLNQRIDMKKYIYDFYKRELKEIKEISMMPVKEWNAPNYCITCIRLQGKIKPIDVIEALEKENMEARPICKPMHLQPFFQGYDHVGGTISEKIFADGVCLPSDTKLTDEDLYQVVFLIRELYGA